MDMIVDKTKKQWMILLLTGACLCMVLFFISTTPLFAADDEADEEKKEELEEEEEELEEEIKKEKEKLQKEQSTFNAISTAYTQTANAVAATKSDIAAREQEIVSHEKTIDQLNEEISIREKALNASLRELYFTHTAVMPRTIAAGETNRALFGAQDALDNVQNKVSNMITRVQDQKETVVKKKESVEGLKEEKEELLVVQSEQQKVLSSERAQAQAVVNERQASISELNAKLSAVQSDLSSLLGESLSTNDIVEAAEFASKKTGVRKSFLLGMLSVESHLGRYTGGCTYSQSRMNGRRAELFKQIAKELDYNYKKLKVSCPPKNYRGTGGAMGVAQFMSDTWMGYKSKIAKNTGNNPPDPWSLTDGVMAMALKLANDGALNGRSGECKAAKRYLGGSHQWYCDKVFYWADNYKQKL